MAKKVLIVEDEQDIIVLLNSRLKANGFEVISANDGLSGLELAREENPDLIILDVGMPKMNGYEVCRMLKFDDNYKSIPIILLTARTQDQDKKIGEEVGANAYMTKPFEPAELVEKVKSMLS